MFNTQHSAANIRLKILSGHSVTDEERTLYDRVERQIEEYKKQNNL